MKHIRRSISFLLALVMVIGMMPPVAARAEETESIEETKIAVTVEEEASIPTEETTEPAEETTAPTEEAAAPTEETLEPSEEITEPTEAVADPAGETGAAIDSGNVAVSAEMVETYPVYGAGTNRSLLGSGKCGDDLTWTLDSEGTLTISGTGIMDHYDYDYELLGAPWGNLRSEIIHIVIEEGAVSISDDAFADCHNLLSVTIPEGVLSIGDNAFSDCYALAAVTIPESVTYIGKSTFYHCESLTNMTIPKAVTRIGDYAFSDCESLVSVMILDGVADIGCEAFCSPNLTGIWVAEGNAHYSSDSSGVLFNKNKTELIQVPAGYTGSYMIPDSVISIGECAVKYCENLTGVTIPDSVTSIGDYAFSACHGLTSVTIPDSVTSIGDYTFSDCRGLTNVTLPDGLTSISYGMFRYCGSLTSVMIPDSVTSIGYYAFSECFGLTSVTIPDGVTSIGRSTFSYCRSLTSVTIPDGVTSIDDYAFYACYSLTSMVIPDGVTSIGDYAFSDCFGLTSVKIPDSVISIGNYAFYVCVSLTSVTIPGSVVSVGDYAFSDCESLTSVYFRGNTPSFGGNSVFYYVTATAYYPENDPTWTSDVMQAFGGTLTWVPYGVVRNRIVVPLAELDGNSSVWIDGVEYAVQVADGEGYVDLPDSNARTMIAYTYHAGDSSDPYTRYPVSMKVWALSNEDGSYTAARLEALDDILQYSGTSIRVTGKKGIRMITSIDQSKKNSLISGGLAGYTLKEYGTVVAWADKLRDTNPLVLGESYAKANYAYKKGVADPVFAYTDSLMQYTNVLVGFNNIQCGKDLAMRSYMILADSRGNEITLYGGTVIRSIGYIAYQNRNSFEAGTAGYEYVWDIIHTVYGNAYDAEYKTIAA